MFGGSWVSLIIVSMGTALIKCGIIVSIIVRSWPSYVEVESGAYYW